MAMLRKALIASFIKPPTSKDKAPEMKNTERCILSKAFQKKINGKWAT